MAAFHLTPRTVLEILKEAALEWDRDNVSRLAAALAYYTVFSLAPLLVIAVGAAGLLFGEAAARGEVVEQIRGLIGGPGAELVERAIANAGRPGSGSLLATAVGLLTLAIGATGTFNQIQGGLNTVWEVAPKPRGLVRSLVRTRLLSFAMVLALGFLLLVSLILSAAISALGRWLDGRLPQLPADPQLLNLGLSLLLITLLLAMIYKILPDAEIPWRGLWLGAGVTAVLFTLGKHLIGLYLANSAVGSAYGAAGTLVILLIWVYFSAQVFYFGAEITQVYTRLAGIPIRPSRHASRLVRVRVEADTAAEAREKANAAVREKTREQDQRERPQGARGT
ncbi:MAG TPA: YihY/virulence factor BrkB family protein [Gemmatimonadota bacterium]|jgi:membrane protein